MFTLEIFDKLWPLHNQSTYLNCNFQFYTTAVTKYYIAWPCTFSTDINCWKISSLWMDDMTIRHWSSACVLPRIMETQIADLENACTCQVSHQHTGMRDIQCCSIRTCPAPWEQANIGHSATHLHRGDKTVPSQLNIITAGQECDLTITSSDVNN